MTAKKIIWYAICYVIKAQPNYNCAPDGACQ